MIRQPVVTFAAVALTAMACSSQLDDNSSSRTAQGAQSRIDYFAGVPAGPALRSASPPAIGPAQSIAFDTAGSPPGHVESVARASRTAYSTAAPNMTRAPEPDATSMIIRTVQASIEVDSLERAVADLRALAARVGGYVGSTMMQGGEEQLREAMVELKIPANRFEDARGGLAELGKLKRLDESAQDVGEEYVDIAARMQNAHRLEARLIGLLATRTGRLDDVLTVERELARVREEIERAEGRLRYFRARASFSTLRVVLSEARPLITRAGENVIAQAFANAWRNFLAFIAVLVSMLGFLVPLGALAGIAWGVVHLIRRQFPTPPPPQTTG